MPLPPASRFPVPGGLSGRYLATASRDGTGRIWDLAARAATTVLLPGAAAVVSPDGTWHGLGETDGLIWQAAGLTRVPLPIGLLAARRQREGMEGPVPRHEASRAIEQAARYFRERFETGAIVSDDVRGDLAVLLSNLARTEGSGGSGSGAARAGSPPRPGWGAPRSSRPPPPS